ncbi:DnaT-like ssDNA-binding protein [uncultured Brevundimonas sp.]|uniref:DnaT-like ssDNA-binding protein n=1 Tax=uncultured Brevundimonas sp. TaxID=213418 RepID=UPI0025F13FCD|nr:DnaT-like ssDNA-binding protein [uncultured Brevundimonas sp.]
MAGYGSDQRFADWMADNGYSTSGDGVLTVAQLRQRGSAYIDALYEPKFPGQRTGGLEQERAFPRTGASAYGQSIGADVIPLAVEHASYHAALQEAAKPGSLSISAVNSGALKRKKVDVIEKEYFQGSGDAVADNTLRLSAVEGLLAPLFRAPEVAVFVV